MRRQGQPHAKWLSGAVAPALTILVVGSIDAQSTASARQSPSAAPTISVGANVQVSKQFPKLPHYETWVTSDAAPSGRLLACSIVQHEEHAARSVHCYTSLDNGKVWSAALELDVHIAPHIGQPAAEYGRGDTAFVVTTVTPYRRGETHIPSTTDNPFPTLNEWGVEGMRRTIGLFRSVDGGRTFEKTASLQFIDRPTLAIDRTAGRYAGRVYVAGSLAVSGYSDGPSSVLLFRSLDGGKTFLGPVQRVPQAGGSFSGQSNSVMLSDGTLAFLVTHVKSRQETSSANAQPQVAGTPSTNSQLQLMTSTDGGVSLNPEVTVSEWYNRPGGAASASQFALFAIWAKQLAVDPGSRYFRDRLYAVWEDAASGRSNIRFAYSADKGRTWSLPITVNDDRAPADPENGPNHSLPTVAVNKDGAVLVAWYDRRENADKAGWRIWGAASLDGGVTFGPNTPISDAAHAYTDQTPWIVGGPSVFGGGTRKPGIEQGRPVAITPQGRPLAMALDLGSFFMNPGGTFGMVAGPDGVFHPTWIDNRTGIAQLWTASVTVRGSVEKHGMRELADLDDITDKVTWVAEATAYDRASGTATITARLKNTSSAVLYAPLIVRVISLSSVLGVPAVVGADNGVRGVGAIWDVSNTVPRNGLLPESTSMAKKLTFQLSDVRAIRMLRESPGFTSRLVYFDARVYGRGATR